MLIYVFCYVISYSIVCSYLTVKSEACGYMPLPTKQAAD